MSRNMSRLKRSRSDENQSRDDEEAIREWTRRKFLDFVEGKKTKKPESAKMVQRGGGGRGGEDRVRNLAEEKPARNGQQCETAVSAMRHYDGNVSQGFGRVNGSHKQKDECGTRSETRSNFCRGPITRFSAKAVGILKENSLDDPMITTNGASKLKQDSLSSETTREISKPSSQTPSLSRRPLNRSSTKAKTTGRIPAHQSRAARLRLCSLCNKSFSNLSAVPGNNLLLCSVCRRKLKAADTVSPLNINFQTHIAQSPDSDRKQQDYIRRRDNAGKTPDTAVKIDSSDEEEAVNDTGSAMHSLEQHCQSDLQHPVKTIAYPSRTDPEAIEISDLDIQQLEPSELLNDTIIDFYIKYIQREFLSLEGGSRFHFFNSFFYKKLSAVAGKKKMKKVPNFSKLRKWTKGINIFEKEYLLIPIHDKLHWSLAIICFPNHGPGSSSRSQRCILHLDSMACGHQSLTIFRLLRRYLVAEWKDTFGEAQMIGDDSIRPLTCTVIPGRKVPVPLQENESDCGLFLLHYMRKFVESAPRTMSLSDVEYRLEDLGVFGREWFSPIEASKLRTSVQKILHSLFAENGMALGKSNDASFGDNDVVKPRNLEAEFRVYL